MSRVAEQDYYWKFYTDHAGKWGWCFVEYTGYILKHSEQFFTLRNDCLHDACLHGYEPVVEEAVAW